MKTTTKAKPKRAAAPTAPAHTEFHLVPDQLEQGEHYVGKINVNGAVYALILPPRATAERASIAWNESLKTVEGALSFCDGLANTQAMAEAGSALAKWALDLGLYLPAMDELELCYRRCKPTKDKNSLYARSGLNVSAIPPTYPYTADFPKQTDVKAFRDGGKEAFAAEWYWSSTQHAGDSGYAWMQLFGDGGQSYGRKSDTYRARAVRRIKL